MINHDINNIAYKKHTRFIHISPDLAQKYAQIFAHWHYLFPEVNKTVIATWRLLCLLSFKHFSQHERFGKLGNIVGHSIVQISHLFEAIRFFSFFFATVFTVTLKLANLPWQTLKFCYERRTLPKHSVLFWQSECFTCKSFISFDILTV